MALSWRNDNQADERLNPATTSSHLNDLENQVAEQSKNDNDTGDNGETLAQDKVADKENQFGYSHSNARSGGKSRGQGLMKLAMKNKGALGVLSVFGLGGGLMAGFFGPATMLVNLKENIVGKNDSSSSVMERRLKKIMNKMLNNAGTGVCNSKKIKCRMGQISNSGLRRMAKKGIVPLDKDGKKMDIKKKGYPSKQPHSYRVDGIKEPLSPAKLKNLLKNDFRQAAKVYGYHGAFNMRVKAWAGKHIKKMFFNKFGIAKISNFTKNLSKKAKGKIKGKLSSLLPKLGEGKNTPSVSGKIDTMMGKYSKGGGLYTWAATACMGTKLPKIIAATVIGIQLFQLIPLINNLLSAGDQTKAGKMPPEASENIGNMLTEKSKKEGSNEAKSALDSPILLSSMGVNKNKSGISKTFAPGYAVLTDPFIQGMKYIAAIGVVKKSCDYILSPVAMYASLGASIALAISSGGLEAVGSFLLKMGAKTVGGKLIKYFGAEKAQEWIENFIKNDKLPHAKGEELGDAIGTSANAFFSSGSMARGIPTLKKSQIAAFNDMKRENEEFQKRMDIASLSPFDTSSKYTFLGSISYGLNQFALINGLYGGNLQTSMAKILHLPFAALSFGQMAHASPQLTENDCGYAKDFDFDDNGPDTPAINLAGLPCTGLTTTQDNMGIDEAIKLLEDKGWIDFESDKSSESQDIQELRDNGIIKEDTPLTMFMDSCMDASTGDFSLNAAGCTFNNPTPPVKKIDPSKVCQEVEIETGEGDNKTTKEEKRCMNDIEGVSETPETVDEKTLSAMSVFLIDYQVAQSINGEDDEPEKTTTNTSQVAETIEEGGMTEEQAKQFMMNYGENKNGGVERVVSDKWNYCNGGGSNCVTFSQFFYRAFSKVKYPNVSGHGYQLAGNMVGAGVPGGKQPKLYSIFSLSRDTYGHTGVVLGIHDGKLIVGHASCSGKGKGRGNGELNGGGSGFIRVGTLNDNKAWLSGVYPSIFAYPEVDTEKIQKFLNTGEL